MRAGAQLPSNRETAQFERVGRENPFGATQLIWADVQQGVAGGRPHAPAEASQSVADLLGESAVITRQMTRGDPVDGAR